MTVEFKLKKIENERLALLSNWTVEDVNYDDWINHNERDSQKALESRAWCSAIGYDLEQLDEEKESCWKSDNSQRLRTKVRSL